MPGSDSESTLTPSMTDDLPCPTISLDHATPSQPSTFMVQGVPRNMKILRAVGPKNPIALQAW